MTKEEKKYLILRSIGNFLFLFAIFGVIATFGPALYFETQFRIIQARGVTFKVVEAARVDNLLGKNKAQSVTFGDLLVGAKEQELRPIDTEFSILIPKIGASAKVFANVDPSNPDEFLPKLLNGVAHAQGTVFPGIPGNIYLFAHSTDNFWNVGRYNAIFYLLKDLEPGDEIVVFYQGERYNYFVSDKQIVDANDVSLITNAKTGDEQLILQTCWPPGTTWKRLLVFARPRKTDVIFKE